MLPANRRRHRVFVTQHSEYHLRDNECVGVRDRHTGRWQPEHAALRLRARRLPSWELGHACLGRRIRFHGEDAQVLTSTVVAVGRPPRTALQGYVSLSCAGEICV